VLGSRKRPNPTPRQARPCRRLPFSQATSSPRVERGANLERAGHPPQRVSQRGLGEPGHALGANAGKSHGPGGEAPPR